MGRIAEGHSDGFRDLYSRYASTAAGLAYRVIGDQVLAEEVVQEVFLSVWRSASARGSVRSWLLTQVHHRAVDVIRREDAERRRSLRQPDLIQADPTEDVVEDEWLRGRRADIRVALRTISDDQRQVLHLAYFDGLTQSQVAEKLGIPLGTVKSRTLSAMLKLREVLSGADR